MSSLDEYELKYEKPRWRRFNTKANRTKLAKAKEQEKQLKKEKQMKTSKIETVKTIVITALVTGIITFIAGTIYANTATITSRPQILPVPTRSGEDRDIRRGRFIRTANIRDIYKNNVGLSELRVVSQF